MEQEEEEEEELWRSATTTTTPLFFGVAILSVGGDIVPAKEEAPTHISQQLLQL